MFGRPWNYIAVTFTAQERWFLILLKMYQARMRRQMDVFSLLCMRRMARGDLSTGDISNLCMKELIFCRSLIICFRNHKKIVSCAGTYISWILNQLSVHFGQVYDINLPAMFSPVYRNPGWPWLTDSLTKSLFSEPFIFRQYLGKLRKLLAL